MAKLLKEVWKTFFGSFFETEQEAADAELLYKINTAIAAAWNESLAPFVDEDIKARAEYDALPSNIRRDRSYPTAQSHKFLAPPEFQKKLIATLKKEGILAPVMFASSAAAA